MGSEDSSRGADYQPGGSPGDVPTVAPVTKKRNWYKWTIAVIAICSLLIAMWAARGLSNLVHQRDNERQAEIERTQEETRNTAIKACESRNQARADQKHKDLFLIHFIVSVSRDPTLAIQQLQPLLDFYETANDPLDCNYDSPTFGKDLTPPPTIEGFPNQ